MLFHHLFLQLAISAILATCLPQTTTPGTGPQSLSHRFHLKTADALDHDHDDHHRFNNLYVSAYHTGAGFNDAVLEPDVSVAATGILNNTNVQFDLGTSFPWGMDMGGDTNYAEWEFVQINAGYGSTGFLINGTGSGVLQWSTDYGFGGWLVCDWWHGAPQLFWLYRYYTAAIPSSCSRVQLRVEYV